MSILMYINQKYTAYKYYWKQIILVTIKNFFVEMICIL
jgi:hypothetical protein